MCSYSDSSDDDILLPNGFDDVGADIVNVDFDQSDVCASPPKKKKKRGKKDKDRSQDSFELDSCQDLTADSLCSPVNENVLLVEDLDCSDITIPDAGRKSRRSKRKGAFPISSRLSPRSTITVDLNETAGDAVVIVEPSSPTQDIFNITSQTSFSFDVEEEIFVSTISTVPDDDPNAEVRIRVLWKGCETNSFNIRKFQSIQEIYAHYARKEGVSEERILFTLRDKPVKPSDTPISLNIGVSSLEGGVTDVATRHAAQSSETQVQEDPNSIKLFIQRNGVKDKLMVYTYPREKIGVLISKISEQLKIPTTSIKLKFEGEDLSPDSTPEDNDIEDEFCIDLITKG